MVVDIEQKIQIFFDNNIPCPSYIKNCEGLREEFRKELEGLRQRPGCSSCMERGLRHRFIERLRAEI